jgi:hypothetical protein
VKKIPALLAFLFLAFPLFSQTPPDSCHLRISLVTCSPGDELFSIFGHTGIRLIDSARNTDVVFNYGTFDDSDPYFYLKFTRGIMRYSLSVWPYSAFMEEYQAEQRNVSEQVLDLSCADKQKLATALFINAQEANRYYNYQFHLDNCTTRARDMIAGYAGAPVHFNNILPPQHPSFRQLIHSYLDKGRQYWNKLAIDLLLGAHLDATVTNEQAMFLPDWLAKGFDSATAGSHPLVNESRPLLVMPYKAPATSWFTPMVVFTVLLVLGIALSFARGPGAQKAVNIFDRILFLLTGLLGIVFWTVWLTRVDTVCSNNWNTLWALPTHAVMAFMLTKKKPWIKLYWIITSLLLAILLIGWKWWPQEMNNALLPFVALLLLRSLLRLKQQ